ncbi:MAG: sugar kinase, partial [Gemmatimonadetes bacterium]|nr:sugar kinase [Gemmatimonadota bacterium]
MAGDSILVVGSVALDQIGTPFGRVDEIVGGAAVHFAAAASLFAPVQLVGVIGDDYPMEDLDFLVERGVDFAGLERRAGHSFRWGGEYHHDMNTRDTTHTELGVFAEFRPTLPDSFREAEWVFLANIDP